MFSAILWPKYGNICRLLCTVRPMDYDSEVMNAPENLLEKFEFFKCLRITLEFIIERDSRETRVLFLGDRLIPF